MTSERYNARESEPRWQRQWDEKAIFASSNDDPRPKYYVLEMFPYPSGRIHIGHVRNYTLGDVLARFMRAMGYNVLHPMGWDAFGLPAENAAIERKVAPKAWTYDNIAAMKKQLRSIGLSLDWSREFATCDPSYYKHQQKLFLDFLRAGLAEREHRKINWDPVDMTVLANEQVIDGRGWRSGALVEQREMKQWVFKITKYSQELLDALDTLDRWPDKVRLMQRNWIGRSEGMLVRFALDPATTPSGERELKIFTTRHDTLFGAKFMAIAPDLFFRVGGTEAAEYIDLVSAMKPEEAQADLEASGRLLRELRATSVGITGFCMGGFGLSDGRADGELRRRRRVLRQLHRQRTGYAKLPHPAVLRRQGRLDPLREHREGRGAPSRHDRVSRRRARLHARPV